LGLLLRLAEHTVVLACAPVRPDGCLDGLILAAEAPDRLRSVADQAHLAAWDALDAARQAATEDAFLARRLLPDAGAEKLVVLVLDDRELDDLAPDAQTLDESVVLAEPLPVSGFAALVVGEVVLDKPDAVRFAA
jgi:hypothetical protein